MNFINLNLLIITTCCESETASSRPTSRGGTKQTPGAQIRQLSWNHTSTFSSVGSRGKIPTGISDVTLADDSSPDGIVWTVISSFTRLFFLGDFFVFFEFVRTEESGSATVPESQWLRESGFRLENQIGSAGTYNFKLLYDDSR
jgi:hypothetical protein